MSGGWPSLCLPADELQERQRAVRGRVGDNAEALAVGVVAGAVHA